MRKEATLGALAAADHGTDPPISVEVDEDGFMLVDRGSHKAHRGDHVLFRSATGAGTLPTSPISPAKTTPKSSAGEIRVPQDDATKFHPDYSMPQTPFDVLFRTSGDVLFWFSLPLLAVHSPVLGTIDHATLRPANCRRRPTHLHYRCVQLPKVSPAGFALILHTISVDWHQQKLNDRLEIPVVLPFPANLRDGDLKEALNEAIETAQTLEMPSFYDLIGPHLLDPARQKYSDKIREDALDTVRASDFKVRPLRGNDNAK